MGHSAKIRHRRRRRSRARPPTAETWTVTAEIVTIAWLDGAVRVPTSAFAVSVPPRGEPLDG
jgi:hypothetical protein